MHFGFSDFDRYFDAGGDPVGRSWNGILARSPVLRILQGEQELVKIAFTSAFQVHFLRPLGQTLKGR